MEILGEQLAAAILEKFEELNRRLSAIQSLSEKNREMMGELLAGFQSDPSIDDGTKSGALLIFERRIRRWENQKRKGNFLASETTHPAQ